MNQMNRKRIEVSQEKSLYMVEILGEKQGKSLVISAGVHGCEYPGIKALLEIEKELMNMPIQGKVILIPIANETAFYNFSRFVSPEDMVNLNRAFPGTYDKSETYALAKVLEDQVFQSADLYLDLHSGDSSECAMNFAYVPGLADPEILRQSIDAARYLNIELWAKSRSTVGAFNHAAHMGIPSLLVERGGQGLLKRNEVEAYKNDIYNVLAYLKMIDQEPVIYLNQLEIENSVYEESKFNGIWTYFVQPGDIIKSGQILGEVTLIEGEIAQRVIAISEGIILYMTTAMGVQSGEPLIAYGKL